jgi:hypothetical protein
MTPNNIHQPRILTIHNSIDEGTYQMNAKGLMQDLHTAPFSCSILAMPAL